MNCLPVKQLAVTANYGSFCNMKSGNEVEIVRVNHASVKDHKSASIKYNEHWSNPEIIPTTLEYKTVGM